MTVEWVRKLCLSFPAVTESVQWGEHLVFKVAGKVFLIASLEPGDNFVAFKADPEEFAELVEREGLIPAPYMQRAKWVAVERPDTLAATELKARITQSYDLVVAKMSAKTRATLPPRVKKAGG